jgi:phage protein D
MMLRPAYRVAIGDRVVDTTDEPKASTAVELTVRLDMDSPADACTLVQGQVGGLPAVPGDDVEVALGYADDTTGTVTVLTGLVVAVEPGIETLRISGHSTQDRLLRAFADTTFQDTSAGEVVRALAAGAGMDVARVETGIDLPAYVVDGRRNVARHIRDLAVLCGFDTYVTPEGALVFEPFDGQRTVHVLRFGEHLLALELARDRPYAATVEAFGESPGSSRGDESWAWLTKDFSPRRGSAGSGAPTLLVERPVLRSAASASTAATAIQESLAAASLHGRVRIQGRPQVRLGDVLRLEAFPASDRTGEVNGNYQVRQVTHTITKSGGFVSDVGFRSLGPTTQLPGVVT